MAPSIFGSSAGRENSSVSLFEIRLDQNNLIFHGSEDEASSAVLKGTLVLCLSDPLSLRNVRMRFTGERRVAWFQAGGSGHSHFKNDDEFFRHKWDFLIPNKRSGETLQKGNYEWPFEYVVPGQSPESVEGLPDTWIIYRLKATVERGILQQNAIARKHIRIIRTLDPSALELSQAASIENVWPDKLDYSLSTPTKAVIFGTLIRIDFKMIPLLKGLKIGNVTSELVETQELTFGPSRQLRRFRVSRSVVKDTWKLPDDTETEEIDGQDGYVFHRQLQIPKSLRHCVQSVDTMGIKVGHALNFNVQLHNPDAHVSELHASLPLIVFISPNLPLDDDNNMINQQNLRPAASESLQQLAPPLYGEHHFDQLYNDVDISGFMTPAGSVSGIGTPFSSQSRTASTENLASVDALTSSELAPNALQSRLNALENAAASRWARDRPYISRSGDDAHESSSQGCSRNAESAQPQHNSIGNSGESPNRTSRRLSEESSTAAGFSTPRHIEFRPEDLCKVPSYSTALKCRATAPLHDGLPNYQAATQSLVSTPPLPQSLDHNLSQRTPADHPPLDGPG